MRMRFLLALLAALAVPATAVAQAPRPAATSGTISASHLAAARELIDLEASVEEMVKMAMSVFDEQVENEPEMEAYRDVMRQWLTDVMSPPEVRDAFAMIYVNHFSEAEIRTIIEFYRTPVGARLVRFSPTVMAESSALGQRLAEPRLGELEARMTRRTAELEAKAVKP